IRTQSHLRQLPVVTDVSAELAQERFAAIVLQIQWRQRTALGEAIDLDVRVLTVQRRTINKVALMEIAAAAEHSVKLVAVGVAVSGPAQAHARCFVVVVAATNRSFDVVIVLEPRAVYTDPSAVDFHLAVVRE